jgi:pyrroline-5-carboxylate reductase
LSRQRYPYIAWKGEIFVTNENLFIIGAGSMAEAFIRGVVAKKAVPSRNIYVMNRSNRERIERLAAEYGIQIAETRETARDARVVVLAVKPADAKNALAEVAPYFHGQMLLSFAAGIPINWLEAQTNYEAAVIRTMPNLPVAVQTGATAMACSASVRDGDAEFVRYLLSQVGVVVDLPESLMDAATAFSGSGPGFVCYFLEAMEAAAVRLGFDALTARALLLQTVIGTARALGEWGLSPEEMRKRVTSPNGTTHAGLKVFEERQLLDVVYDVLKAAEHRSTEMGQAYSVEPSDSDSGGNPQ